MNKNHEDKIERIAAEVRARLQARSSPTIGGAVAGCAIESMSYKHGGFHDSCLELELVTGTGELLLCSRDENRDLFEMIHGSYGTLGIVTQLKFKLIPAKPFVRMEYLRFESLAAERGTQRVRLSRLRSERGALVLSENGQPLLLPDIWSAEVTKVSPAKTVGLVAIVVGTVLLGGLIAYEVALSRESPIFFFPL